ncbi:RmlC-like cupin [Trametopsis cervina]|nr:RmlC-like cupin [Trametopsis cervina]
MFSPALLLTFVIAAVSASPAPAADPAADLLVSLKTAATQADRVNLLKDGDFKFDFINAQAGVTKGAGGRAVAANVKTFPALIGQGVAMTVGFLEACGMNTPHTHPRATEILYSVNGTLTSGTIGENGSRFVNNTLYAGEGTVFPLGSIHFQANEECKPVTFVSAFNYEDPGTLSAAQRYFGLPPDVVAASLGLSGVEEVVGLEHLIPDNIALGRAECLKRCGLTANVGEQPTTQRQPRLPGNELPVVSESASASSAWTSATASATSAKWSASASASTAY